MFWEETALCEKADSNLIRVWVHLSTPHKEWVMDALALEIDLRN